MYIVISSFMLSQIVWDSLYWITSLLDLWTDLKGQNGRGNFTIHHKLQEFALLLKSSLKRPVAAVEGQLRNCFSSRESHLHINAVVLLATRQQCFKGFWNWLADALGIKSPQCINLSLIHPKQNKTSTDLWCKLLFKTPNLAKLKIVFEIGLFCQRDTWVQKHTENLIRKKRRKQAKQRRRFSCFARLLTF